MRIPLLCTILLAACAGGDKAPATGDSTPPAAAPAPPPALTAAQVTGTWTGTTKLAGTDSVVGTWTAATTSDSTGVFTGNGEKPVDYTTVLSGDSMIVTSAPHMTKMTGKAKVMWVSVGRLDANGGLAGTSMMMLAEKHDSILSRTTWTATKKP